VGKQGLLPSQARLSDRKRGSDFCTQTIAETRWCGAQTGSLLTTHSASASCSNKSGPMAGHPSAPWQRAEFRYNNRLPRN
jgi:hypothetical protein